MAVRAYSYIRMSRPEQLRGDSLRRQVEAAQAWAAARGVEIDDTLRDIGISAYRGRNRDEGALRRFLDLVEAGAVPRGSYLIVESLDRLSREAVLEALPRFLDLIRAGVVIVTLADQQEYSSDRLKADWTPLILSLAVMARAHEESRMKGLRVGEAWAKKRRKAAEKPLTARTPEWLQLVDGRIEIIPERANIIRRIFELAADGQGKRTIAMTLNGEGVPAFRSRKGWHPSYIGKVLDSRAALGEYQPCRKIDGRRVPEGDPVPDYYPAVVSEQLFHRAQAARVRRTAAPGRRDSEFISLIRGLPHCRECGARMAMTNKGRPPKGGRYLRCSAASRNAGCGNARLWRYDRVEDAVIERVTALDVAAVIEGEDFDEDAAAGVHDLRTLLEAAEKKRARWAELVDLDQDDDLAADRYRQMTAEVRRLKRDIAMAERENAQAKADGPLSSRMETVREFREALAAADPVEARDLRARLAEALRRLLERVDCGPDTVVARYRLGAGPSRRLRSGDMKEPARWTSAVLIDESAETAAARIAEDEATEAEEEREAERSARSLARLRRRKAG